jgi:DNA-binding NtrC family response regulator
LKRYLSRWKKTKINVNVAGMEQLPKKDTPILIVDDDSGHLLTIQAILKRADMPEAALVSDSRHVLPLIREHRFPFVLLDLMMPHIGGMDLLKQIKTEFPETECVILTAIDDIDSAIQAIKFGAYDYIVKPFSSDKIIIVINHALDRYYLRHGLALFEKRQTFADLKKPDAFAEMVAAGEDMALVFHQAEVVAATDYSVIITGESGTGKEMLARAIHRASNRAQKPFLAVNMGAFSSALFESEFFGHAKGAYTGASGSKEGFLEAARGGTLFLDEITDLELSRQAVLLRVLQEGEFYRLGSTEIRKMDVRILTATNQNIAEEVSKGRFRADLFHRLNMYHIRIPRLRERQQDVLPIAKHFLKIYAEQAQKKIGSLSPQFEVYLTRYTFPGNVRELKNIIAAAVLQEKGTMLSLSSLGQQLSLLPDIPEIGEDDETMLSLAEMEKRHINRVLSAADGNRTQAAKILGLGLRTLQRKLKQYAKTP